MPRMNTAGRGTGDGRMSGPYGARRRATGMVGSVIGLGVGVTLMGLWPSR